LTDAIHTGSAVCIGLIGAMSYEHDGPARYTADRVPVTLTLTLILIPTQDSVTSVLVALHCLFDTWRMEWKSVIYYYIK